MIIANYIEKIKRLGQKAIYFLAQKDTLVSLIVVATGVSAFALGYYAGKDTASSSARVVFTESNKVAVLASAALAVDNESSVGDQATQNKTKTTVFGSKSGTKYYYSWCKTGNRVKLENRVYFESGEQAEKAGRTIAANCK